MKTSHLKAVTLPQINTDSITETRQDVSNCPISGFETYVLMTLIRYVANNENVTVDWLEAGCCKSLKVNAIHRIPAPNFLSAIHAVMEAVGITGDA